MLIKIGNVYLDPMETVFIGDEYVDIDGTHYLKVRFKNAGREQLIEATMDEAEAALIDAGVIEELTCDELPELSEEELQTLSGLRARGYEYLARDEDGRLYAYKFPPAEDQGFFMPGSPAENAERIDRSFDFIAPGDFFAIGELLPG